jgi:hypothetical protein
MEDPERSRDRSSARALSTTWADFLRSQADALLACDFLDTTTLTGARMHVLAVLEHASRRIRILGAKHNVTTVTCWCSSGRVNDGTPMAITWRDVAEVVESALVVLSREGSR